MAKIPGIFERPRESGIHWISYFDADGKRHREKAGRLSAALDMLADRRARVRKGEYIPSRRAWTFRRLAAAAIAAKSARIAAVTAETYRLRLGKLDPVMGAMRYDRITPQRVEEILAGLKRGGLSNSTVNRYRSLISSVFNFATKMNPTASNPVSRVKRYRENAPRVRCMTAEEEARLRKEFTVDAEEWEFDLALYTGMRRGEQFFLRWADVHPERKLITVCGKTGRRDVAVNKTARAALENLRKLTGDREFVCPGNDGSAARDWRTWFEEAVKRAGIRDLHFHDLRHTFATRLVMERVDLRTVQQLLGHKSIEMTEKYSHPSADHRGAAVEKMKRAE